MTQDIVARLRELLSKATPVRDELKLRSRDGEDHYQLIGVPCGFPVATFGDVADAEFDLVARQTLPTLLDRLQPRPAADRVETVEMALLREADIFPRIFILQNEVDRLARAAIAAYERSGAEMVHASDCAVHNEPESPVGKCDCGLVTIPHVERLLREDNERLRNNLEKAIWLIGKAEKNTNWFSGDDPYGDSATVALRLALKPTAKAVKRNATERDAGEAIAILEQAILAARNSNQAGENAVVRAAAALSLPSSQTGREEALPSEPTEAMFSAYEELCIFPDDKTRLEHRQAMAECWSTMLRAALKTATAGSAGETGDGA